MKVILWLSVSCLFLAFGQTTVALDTTGYIPTVKVEDQAAKAMCQAFAKKLDTKAGRISFRPKPTFDSRIKDAGEVWVVDAPTERVEMSLRFVGQTTTENSSTTKIRSFEFSNSELPLVLQKIVGPLARNVRMATCYTRDNHFFNTENIVLIPTNREEAEQLVSALR